MSTAVSKIIVVGYEVTPELTKPFVLIADTFPVKVLSGYASSVRVTFWPSLILTTSILLNSISLSIFQPF